MALERIAIDRNGDTILTLYNYPNKSILETATVQYQVFSTVLRASSPYFEAIFKHSFVESFRVFGQHRFTAHNFDAVALKYVLITLHTTGVPAFADPKRGCQVGAVWDGLRLPRVLPLDMLVAIADVMEYYHIEVIEPVVVESWFGPYKNAKGKWDVLPRTYSKEFGKELMMWLSLGRRFQIRSLCDQAAEVICATCLSKVNDFGWPVPRDMLDALDREISRRLRGDLESSGAVDWIS